MCMCELVIGCKMLYLFGWYAIAHVYSEEYIEKVS